MKTEDYTSLSFFPYRLSEQTGQTGTPLVHGYISSSRVADFVKVFKLKILQKVMPGLNKPGYIEPAEEKSYAFVSCTCDF